VTEDWPRITRLDRAALVAAVGGGLTAAVAERWWELTGDG